MSIKRQPMTTKMKLVFLRILFAFEFLKFGKSEIMLKIRQHNPLMTNSLNANLSIWMNCSILVINFIYKHIFQFSTILLMNIELLWWINNKCLKSIPSFANFKLLRFNILNLPSRLIPSIMNSRPAYRTISFRQKPFIDLMAALYGRSIGALFILSSCLCLGDFFWKTSRWSFLLWWRAVLYS